MRGSIEERGDGVWRIRVSVGVDHVTGKRRVIRQTVRGDRRDADMALARILVDVGDGKALGTNATVADLMAAWFPKKRQQLAASTAADWERVIRLHITPHIGNIPLRKLSVFQVDQLYADLAAKGVSADRIGKVHTVLRVALKRAVKWQWISANPCVDADRPTIAQREAVAPNPASVRDLFTAAEQRGLMALVMLRIAASLGCRRGELCGLQWADIDLDRRTIHVRRAVGIINGREYVKAVKNDKRRSGARIPVHVAHLLKQWRLASAERRLATGTDWVFHAPEVDSFYRPDCVSRLFRELRDEAGIPTDVKLHGLRHYVGTHMRDLGVDHDVISRRLGHARTSTTLDLYGHAVDGRDTEAADLLEQLTQGDAAGG